MQIRELIKESAAKIDKDRRMAVNMNHCDRCGCSRTSCINSFGGNDYVAAWYEMRCEECGAVWTVYDR